MESRSKYWRIKIYRIIYILMFISIILFFKFLLVAILHSFGYNYLGLSNRWIIIYLIILISISTFLKLNYRFVVLLGIILLSFNFITSIPKKIDSAHDFNKICKNPKGNFVLTSDVDFDDVEEIYYENSKCKSYSMYKFAGILNGNNKKIYNLKKPLFQRIEGKSKELYSVRDIEFINPSTKYIIGKYIFDAHIKNIDIVNYTYDDTESGAIIGALIGGSVLEDISINETTIKSNRFSVISLSFINSNIVNVEVNRLMYVGNELNFISGSIFHSVGEPSEVTNYSVSGVSEAEQNFILGENVDSLTVNKMIVDVDNVNEGAKMYRKSDNENTIKIIEIDIR